MEEIAQIAGMHVEAVRRVMDIGRNPVSLDRPVGEGEDCSFGEFIEDSSTDNPVRQATNSILQHKIERLLKTLTYREREIIRLRYGLGDGYTYTLEEVGRIFKVTRERVRQIEAKAVRKLQNPVRSQHLEGFLHGTVPIEALPDKKAQEQEEPVQQPGESAAVVGETADAEFSGFDPAGEFFQKDFQFDEAAASYFEPGMTDAATTDFGS